MKLKTILLTTAILAGLFSSCSEESYVSPDIDGEDAILSLNLSVKEELVSKAGNNIDYVKPAAGDEKSMSNYVIAVFDGEKSDARIAFTAAKITATTQLAVNNIVVKGGTNRKVLIIANLPESDYTALAENGNTDNYATLSKFRAELKLIQKGAFQSNGLVKVLLKENVTLTKGTVNTLGTQSSPLQLIQLPARVDVKVGFNEEDKKQGASFQIKKFTVEGINTASDVILTDMTKVENKQPDTKSSINWEGEAVESFSFYTYEKLTSNNPVVIKITGILRENTLDTEGVEKSYTFTFDASNNPAGIIHGNLYEVAGMMNLNSKTISFEVKVKDWNSVLVDADIKDVHYLFVKEHEIHMANINSYAVDYASDLEIDYQIVSVTYTGYDTEGNKVPGSYKVGQDQYPIVNISDNSKINISFKATPINYVPTYIVLMIKTVDKSLSETINVIHYPTPYVEAWWNDMKQGGVPDGIYSSNKSNHNIFTITSIASGTFIIGDPRDPETGKTKTDWESNQIVSPRFVIASQWGIASTHTYANAQERCYNYKEGPYQKDHSWRMPTLAEITFINKLQYDKNSAVKKLLQGEEYWSACQYWYYNISGVSNDNGFSQGSSSTKTYIRCVHDVY